VRKQLSEGLNKKELGCIWHDLKEDNASGMSKFKERHSDTEYHSLSVDSSDERSLISDTQFAVHEMREVD
jgi:hypothetical protein